MSNQTYINAIAKIENDPLSFMFCSHATKRERQLAKFKQAVQQLLALDGAIAPDNQQVLPADVLAGEGTLPEPPRQ